MSLATDPLERVVVVMKDGAAREAPLGALALYLDITNLFLMLLQLVGQRRE